jgi:hypothetical protein
MDNVVTTSAMEAFLLNPTEMSDRYAESPSLALKTRRRSDPLASNTGKRTLHQSKESSSDPLVEQLYWRRYNSDEEALSSAESDTESIDSASSGEILEMTTARLSIVSAEEVARSCNPIEQTIYCAQAVYLQPVNQGNAKLSPRLVEIPPSPRFERSQNMGYYKPSQSRLSKLDTTTATRHHRSVASTPRSSLENSSNASTPSTPPSSIDDHSPVSFSEKVIRRKSAVSSMRSVAKREFSINSHNMPDAQTLREFLASAPSTQERPLSEVPAHLTTPSKRKLRKFSSSFSLGRFNPIFAKRNSSAGNLLEEMPAVPSKYITPSVPEVYRPTRCSSLLPPPSTKMIARGGNERAPPIVLPPCPNDSEDDGDHVGPIRGHLQRAPKSYSPTGAPKTGRKLHRRQRSLSADDIMMASS